MKLFLFVELVIGSLRLDRMFTWDKVDIDLSSQFEPASNDPRFWSATNLRLLGVHDPFSREEGFLTLGGQFLYDRSRKAGLVIYRCSSLKMERHSLWSISCIISDRESEAGLSWSSTANTCFVRDSHTLRPKTSRLLCDVGQEGRRSVDYTLWRIQIHFTLLLTSVDCPFGLKVGRFSRSIWLKDNGNTCITCKLHIGHTGESNRF